MERSRLVATDGLPQVLGSQQRTGIGEGWRGRDDAHSWEGLLPTPLFNQSSSSLSVHLFMLLCKISLQERLIIASPCMNVVCKPLRYNFSWESLPAAKNSDSVKEHACSKHTDEL